MDQFNSSKVANINVRIPRDNYNQFRDKAYSEGYSINKALILLIENYIKDRLIITQ